MNIFNKNYFLFFIFFLFLLFLKSWDINKDQDLLTKSSYFFFSKVQGGVFYFHKGIAQNLKKYLFLLSLREENTTLKRQNKELKAQQQIFQEILKENHRLKKLHKMNLHKEYKLLSAQVVSTDFLSTNEFFTINKGSRQGVRKFMGVVHSTGFVGYIFRVTPKFSQVLTLISPLSSIPARNQRSRIRGLVEGYKRNLLRFNYLKGEKALDLQVGDSLVVQASEQFPSGFLIGHIFSLDKKLNKVNPSIYIQPAVSFSTLEEVFVVLDFGKKKE